MSGPPMSPEDQERFFAGAVKAGTLSECFWKVATEWYGPDHETWVKAAFERAVEAALAAARKEAGDAQ